MGWESGEVVRSNRTNLNVKGATKDGMKEVSQRKRDEKKKKEQKLVEIATEIAIEQYGPALKELENH